MNAKIKKLTKIIDIAALVDRLGRTKADIADLEKVEKADLKTLKARGVGAYEGKLFAANVFKQERGKVIDWEAIAKELKARASLIAQHTETKTVTTTNWEAVAQELEPDQEIIKKHTTVGQEVTVCTVTAR